MELTHRERRLHDSIDAKRFPPKIAWYKHTAHQEEERRPSNVCHGEVFAGAMLRFRPHPGGVAPLAGPIAPEPTLRRRRLTALRRQLETFTADAIVLGRVTIRLHLSFADGL